MRTAIGKAVLANQLTIELVASALLYFIDEKILSLQQKLPNSDDGQAAIRDEIGDCDDLKQNINEFLGAARQFSADESNEPVVVQATNSVEKGLGNWWHKDHVQICSKAFDMSLFALGVSVCALAGAGGTLAAMVPGVLIGGGPVLDAIKAWATKKD